MVSVRTRRKVAVAGVAAFLAASGLITWVATRDYSPAALRARAEAAFHSATGREARLGEARVSIEGSVTFDGAAIEEGGREIARCGAVVVTGLPGVLSGWRPRLIEARQASVTLDLADPRASASVVRTLDDIVAARRAGSVLLPEHFTVCVHYPGAPKARYVASSARFVEKRELVLRPIELEEPEGWEFVFSSEGARLSSSGGGYRDELTDAVAAATERLLGGDTEGTFESLEASWNAEGETISVELGARACGRRLSRAAGMPEEGFEAVLARAVVRDGALYSAEGYASWEAGSVARRRLAQWVSLLGGTWAEGGEDDEFENVRMAADIRLEDGVVTIERRSGNPALIWSVVDEEPIVLFAGGAEMPLAEVMARIAALQTATLP